jgi:hypothetical protein
MLWLPVVSPAEHSPRPQQREPQSRNSDQSPRKSPQPDGGGEVILCGFTGSRGKRRRQGHL